MTTPSDIERFDAIAPRLAALRSELGRVVVGQQATVELLLAALLCQGHVLIVGVPGLAKTLLVRSLAAALGLGFKRIQFTPDLMPSDVVGTEVLQEDRGTGVRSLRFVAGPVFTNLVLADEVNRASPRTQAALLEAMAERQVTVAGRSLPLEPPFVVVATQNPIEQEGTYPLPEAQLDRFQFGLWMDYPSRDEEMAVVTAGPARQHTALNVVLDHATLLDALGLVERMPVSQHVVGYAVTLCRASRPGEAGAAALVKQYVSWGAGPRGSQCLVEGAKALAAMEGEATPGAGHVRRIAEAVLRHRLVLNYAAAADGVGAERIVQQIVAQTPEP